MPSLDTKIPPPLVGVACAGFMSAIAIGVPALVIPIPSALQIGLVIALVMVTAVFDLTALVSFRRAATTIDPRKPDRTSVLVTSGVYRWSRNPMYVGLASLLTAWAVYLGSLGALLVVVGFVFYLNRFQIGPEERAMKALFGEAYVDYCQRVRRWL